MEFILNLLNLDWLGGIAPYIGAITTVVGAATAITAITPTKVDDTAINFVLKVLNLLAGNFLKNKNADGG